MCVGRVGIVHRLPAAGRACIRRDQPCQPANGQRRRGRVAPDGAIGGLADLGALLGDRIGDVAHHVIHRNAVLDAVQRLAELGAFGLDLCFDLFWRAGFICHWMAPFSVAASFFTLSRVRFAVKFSGFSREMPMRTST